MGTTAFNLLSCCVLSLLLLFPALCLSHETYVHSKASFYGSPGGNGTPNGACRYGEFGSTMNGGLVAAVSRLYRNGTGCGACYLVRCTLPKLCNKDGVTLVVTDRGYDDDVDFVISPGGLAELARPDMASKLQAHGVVDVEYRRISCKYPGSNLMFKVHEQSIFPYYVAIFFTFKAGQSDVTAVEISQEGGKQWKALRNSYGAIWETPNPPKGPLILRFQVSGKEGKYWVQAPNAIPRYWKAGVSYDSGMQLR